MAADEPAQQASEDGEIIEDGELEAVAPEAVAVAPEPDPLTGVRVDEAEPADDGGREEGELELEEGEIAAEQPPLVCPAHLLYNMWASCQRQSYLAVNSRLPMSLFNCNAHSMSWSHFRQ